MEVIYIYFSISRGIFAKGKDFSVAFGFGGVVLWVVEFEEGRCVGGLVVFALVGVTGRDEFFELKAFEILGKEFGEIAPFGVVAGEQHGFVLEKVGVVIEVGIDFLLDVVVLGIELVVFCVFRFGKVVVSHIELG